MKRKVVIAILVFLVSAGVSVQRAAAQDKSKADQEKEVKILKEIEEQKKALSDQKKAQDEVEASMEEQAAKSEDDMEDFQINVDAARNSGKAMKFYYQNGGDRRFNEPFIISPGIEFNRHFPGGDTESTTWDYSRSVKENTSSRDFTFDVEKTANTVVMSVMGDCKAGDIRIRINMPSGKIYSDVVIDESGNLNWRKSFTISETENKDKTGEWKFQITSNKATGYFKISLQTY